MRILLTTDSYLPVVSGVTTVVHSLGQELEKQGHTVAVMAPIKSLSGSTESFTPPKILGIVSLRNPVRRDHYLPIPLYRDLKQKIDAFVPDVIHIHSAGPIGIFATRIAHTKHIPVIASCHGVPGFITSYFPRIPTLIRRSMEGFMWKYLRWFYNSVDHIVAPSEFIQRILIKHGVKKPMTEIPMWIGLPSKKLNATKRGMRQNWHIPVTSYVFLYFGRLDDDKNLPTLLSAFKQLHARAGTDHQPYLFIVGRGRKGNYLENYIRKHRIHNAQVKQIFISQKRVEEMYVLSDAFVMPGPFEAQSIVSLQAIAHNLPVILTNDGALPEIAHRFPDRSYLYNTHPKDLVRVMKSLIEKRAPSPVDTIIFNKYYNKSYILSKYISLYQSLSSKPLR